MQWWTFEGPGARHQIVFLHIDLSGHSQWAEGADSSYTIARQRAHFAIILQDVLGRVGFDRLYWLGDGGLFARKCEDQDDARRVCQAAAEAFGWFRQWCEMYGLEDSGLALRVAGTFDHHVLVDPEPGNWFSTRMNLFLKRERLIAYPNAFVITDELRKTMDPDGPEGRNFEQPFDVELPAVPKYTVTVWAHRDYPRRIQESPLRFGRWLSKQTSEGALPAGTFRDEEVESLHQVGKSVILNSAYSLDGYSQIQLVRLEAGSPETDILPEDRSIWQENRNRLGDRPGTNLRVLRFIGELTDDPIIRLEWCDVDHPSVRAFHDVLEQDVEAPRRYLRSAKRVLQDGTHIPNTLSNHIVIFLRDETGEREVLIAHRRKGGRPGTWFANCWSFSMEEQFNPVLWKSSDDRKYEPDTSVHDSIVRGVKEEFLGDEFKGDIQVGIHAFQMESAVLNYGFLAIVDLPQTTFEELAAHWEHAVDKDEHDVIAAVPLEPGVLKQCLKSEELPGALWDEIVRTGKRCGGDLEPGDHNWHSTAHARVALTLWYVDVHRNSLLAGVPGE